MYYLTAY